MKLSPGPSSSGAYNRLPASSAGLSLRMIPNVTEMPRFSVHRGDARHQWRGTSAVWRRLRACPSLFPGLSIGLYNLVSRMRRFHVLYQSPGAFERCLSGSQQGLHGVDILDHPTYRKLRPCFCCRAHLPGKYRSAGAGRNGAHPRRSFRRHSSSTPHCCRRTDRSDRGVCWSGNRLHDRPTIRLSTTVEIRAIGK